MLFLRLVISKKWLLHSHNSVLDINQSALVASNNKMIHKAQVKMSLNQISTYKPSLMSKSKLLRGRQVDSRGQISKTKYRKGGQGDRA
jgi:hypothetical protein